MRIMEAIAPHLPAPATTASAAGPFAFANADTISGILSKAGFDAASISIERHEESLNWASTVDAGVELLTHVGPGARQLAACDDEAMRARATAALRESVAKHMTSAGLVLGSSAWVVTARV